MRYRNILFLLYLLLFSFFSYAEEEFLKPEQAFNLVSTQIETDKQGKYLLNATWKIAPDYYLYKSKFSFSSNNKEITIGKAILPDGKVKNDEFFGKIEIYKKQLTVKIPISVLTVIDSSNLSPAKPFTPAKTFTIVAKSQGCAEAGICYPPLRQTIDFVLPKNIKPAQLLANLATNSKPGLSSNLPSNLSVNEQQEEFIDPEKAFQFDIKTNKQGKIIASWDITKGYYLYKDKFKFSSNSTEYQIAPIDYPKAKQKSDEFLGDYEVYDKKFSIEIPLQSKATQTSTANTENQIELKIQYQGCAAAGICYPLQKKTFSVDSKKVNVETISPSSGALKTSELSEQDALANYLSKGNAFLILITFFGLGLALAFTPCVFPMIPILSGIIAGQGDKVDTRKAFMISVVYVLAMAVTYTMVGVFAGLSGENIQIWFQNPWVLGSFALVFVVLALSMFGFYELQLPSSLQSKIAELSNKQKGGSYGGVIIMGFLSALIVGPCVAPPLMGALIYISQTGDPFLGGGALFFMSLGMGLPLIIIGTSAGKLLPRAGMWMDSVKAAFGMMMLGVAVWMLERILPGVIILWLWAILFVASAVYIGALTPINEQTTGWARLRKSIGIILLIYGIILIIGASAGKTDMMQPLKGFSAGSGINSQASQEAHLQFKKITSMEQLNKELQMARNNKQNVLLDYYADWCISCAELEKYTFSDAKVIESLNGFVLLQADVTKDNEESKKLLKNYRLIGPPALLFFDSHGQELRHFRLVGFKDTEQFVNHINKFKNQ